jgi:hypothetical protein
MKCNINLSGRACVLSSLLSAAILASAAGTARAQTGQTELMFQVSLDGTNWSSRIAILPLPGVATPVLMRAKVRYIPGLGEPMPIAFASLTWQPVFSNVRVATDRILPFAARGNNLTGGAVTLDSTPLDGPFGRLSPFAGTGPSTSQSYVVHTHTAGSGGAPEGNFYRIARNDVTRWMGTGPTNGTAAVNNFNGAGGVSSVQRLAGRTPSDPAVSYDLEPVLLQMGIVFESNVAMDTRVVGIGAPVEGMSRSPTTGVRQASWVRDLLDTTGLIKGNVIVDGAEIMILPAPGVAGVIMFAAGMVGMVRRRRVR